jgi:TusA-related sulfurtransferase
MPGQPERDLDLSGEVCPYTFLKARLALEELALGASLRVIVDNEPSARDVPRSLAAAGQAVLEVQPLEPGRWVIRVRRQR